MVAVSDCLICLATGAVSPVSGADGAGGRRRMKPAIPRTTIARMIQGRMRRLGFRPSATRSALAFSRLLCAHRGFSCASLISGSFGWSDRSAGRDPLTESHGGSHSTIVQHQNNQPMVQPGLVGIGLVLPSILVGLVVMRQAPMLGMDLPNSGRSGLAEFHTLSATSSATICCLHVSQRRKRL